MLKRLRKLLTTPSESLHSPTMLLWMFASLAVSGYCIYLAMRGGFRGEYVVQDDARQIVFWMRRFVDPELFPHDMIADYYQSLTPAGFELLYRAAAKIGIDPIQFNKVLPAVLGLATTAYGFALCMQLFPVPAAAFTTTVLLNQALWQRLDISSATPRAFFYPFCLAFLFYLPRSRVACLITVALAGLFYAPAALIIGGALTLSLIRWDGFHPKFTRDRQQIWTAAAGLVITAGLLLIFALKSAHLGPTITAAQGRALPFDFAGARLRFLHHDPWMYWLWNSQSGLLANMIPLPVLLGAGVLLPAFWFFRKRLPLAHRVDERVSLLPSVLAVSLGLFFLSHAVLFRLYLPSRYSQHSFLLVAPFLAGIGLILMLDAVLGWVQSHKAVLPTAMAVTAVTVVAVLLFTYPFFVKRFPRVKWIRGKDPKLYEFLLGQPKDTLIATLSEEGNLLPVFAQRPVLVAQEFANPYQEQHYLELRRRYTDQLHAHYTTDLNELKKFVRKYDVDVIVLDNEAFTTQYLSQRRPLRRFRALTAQIKEDLKQGRTPALQNILEKCTTFKTSSHIVIDAHRILEIDNSPPP